MPPVRAALANFPDSKGRVSGLLKCMLALSPSFFNLIFVALLNSSPLSYLAFLATCPSVIALVLASFTTILPQRYVANDAREDTSLSWRFSVLYLSTVTLTSLIILHSALNAFRLLGPYGQLTFLCLTFLCLISFPTVLYEVQGALLSRVATQMISITSAMADRVSYCCYCSLMMMILQCTSSRTISFLLLHAISRTFFLHLTSWTALCPCQRHSQCIMLGSAFASLCTLH